MIGLFIFQMGLLIAALLCWYRPKIRNSLLLIVIAISIFFMVGCSDPPPESGYLINKEFSPEHWESGWDTYYVPEFQCRTVTDYYNGQSTSRQVCETEMVARQQYNAHHHIVPDTWRFQLEDCYSSDDDKCKRGWRRVDETTFHEYEIGDHYPNPR